MKLNSRQQHEVQSAVQFLRSNINPAAWRGSISEYSSQNDRFTKQLLDISRHCEDEKTIEQLGKIIESLSIQKMQFQSYWLDKTVDAVSKLSKEQKDILQDQNEIKETLSHFETRMIEVFSVVMGLISFVFVTAEKVSELEFLDCLKFCLIYIFSISLFVALIKCIMTKKMDTDDLNTLGIIIAVPSICVLFLILMIFLI